MTRSRKPAAIKWSRFRRHNLKLFLKPFCWTLRQARPGSCITKRGRRFNGFPFGFRLERTGLRLPCRRRRTPLAYRAERRVNPNCPTTASMIAGRSVAPDLPPFFAPRCSSPMHRMFQPNNRASSLRRWLRLIGMEGACAAPQSAHGPDARSPRQHGACS